MTARTVTDEQDAVRRVRAMRRVSLRRQFGHWAGQLDDTQLGALHAGFQDRLPRLLEPAREDAR